MKINMFKRFSVFYFLILASCMSSDLNQRASSDVSARLGALEVIRNDIIRYDSIYDSGLECSESFEKRSTIDDSWLDHCLLYFEGSGEINLRKSKTLSAASFLSQESLAILNNNTLSSRARATQAENISSVLREYNYKSNRNSALTQSIRLRLGGCRVVAFILGGDRKELLRRVETC